MTAPLKRRGAAFYAFWDGAISLKGKRRNETWKNRYYLSGDFPPFGGWRHHLCPVGSVSLDSQSPYGSLRIQFPCHPAKAGGTMGAGLLSQFMFMVVTPENHTTGLRPWKCTPFGAAHHFPRRGKFALRSALDLISTSRHSAARISPSGGEAVGRRGAFPTRRRRGCMVCHRAKPGCKGFYTNWRPKGATTTL